MVTKTHSAKI